MPSRGEFPLNAPHVPHLSRQATQADWQVSNEGDFIQLEPWAVPCDNSWMKDLGFAEIIMMLSTIANSKD